MSFFARRAKAKPESLATPDPTRSLFSHSGSFLAQQKERIEREKRQAEKEQEREQQKKEKKQRTESIKRGNPDTDSADLKGDLKRRRISSKESEKLLAIAGLPAGPIELESSDDDADQSLLPVRRSPRHARSPVDDYGLSKTRSMLRHVTAVPTENSEDGIKITGSAALPAPRSSDDEDEFSDPELAELSKKARRAARARQSQEKKTSSSEANAAGEAPDAETDTRSRSATTEPQDPVITIFITSDIPNTGSLLIRRKMSQPIGKVRTAWCDRYKLPSHIRDGVFLTFCGRRQYDSTTCQRLGLRVDAHGRTVREDGNLDELHDQVHVEAFTEALFAERQAEKSRQAKADNGNYDVEKEDEAEPEPEKKEIKILIRVKGKEPAKLRVLPLDSIAKIIKGAKKTLGLSKEQAVRLEFDGEPLDPELLVRDTGFEDMENLDMFLES